MLLPSWNSRHPKAVKIINARSYQKHRVDRLAYQEKYSAEHLEEIADYQAVYYEEKKEENPDGLKKDFYLL